jgi:hypothetical protein
MNKMNPRTKDQGPDPLQNMGQTIWRRQILGPKTKEQIHFCSFPMNKMTSSQKQQTKDQVPDPIQFLYNEQNDFFRKAADQRPRTRSYSVPFQGRN